MKGRWLKLFLTAAALVGLVPAAMLYAATRTAPCDRTEVTASIGTSGAALPAGPPPDRLDIVLVATRVSTPAMPRSTPRAFIKAEP